MKINWRNILTNKATLTALAAAAVAFIYQLLSFFGIVPSITESQITDCIGLFINILVGLGIVTNPNTPGIGNKDGDEEARG